MSFTSSTIPSKDFYGTWSGHEVHSLTKVLEHVRTTKPDNSIVWLAGDSSLDSKFWFSETAPACNGMEDILDPPISKQDIAYHLNRLFVERDVNSFCVNTAVEETTISDRNPRLLPQDEFIRDHIGENDTLIISIGGNDVVLRPSLMTIANMLMLMKLNSLETIRKGPAHAWGSTHFVRLFRDQVQSLVERLICKTKPKRVIVCMIYFRENAQPDERPSGGWADRALGHLEYFTNAEKLQTGIRLMYEHATCKIELDGVPVVPYAMFEIMDGKDSSLYCQGVEPSAKGNRELAEDLFPLIIDGD